jgi:hypothetical protein
MTKKITAAAEISGYAERAPEARKILAQRFSAGNGEWESESRRDGR